jgi:hypothetical protein
MSEVDGRDRLGDGGARDALALALSEARRELPPATELARIETELAARIGGGDGGGGGDGHSSSLPRALLSRPLLAAAAIALIAGGAALMLRDRGEAGSALVGAAAERAASSRVVAPSETEPSAPRSAVDPPRQSAAPISGASASAGPARSPGPPPRAMPRREPGPDPTLATTTASDVAASAPPEITQATAPSELADEVALVRAARAAIGEDPARALSIAERHRAQFPEGMLVEERETLAVEALVALARHDEARRRAARFFTRWPASPYQRRIESALARR